MGVYDAPVSDRMYHHYYTDYYYLLLITCVITARYHRRL